MRARLTGLSLLAVSGCVRLNEDHCANQDAPLSYCFERHTLEFCSKCESQRDGCVDAPVADSSCFPDNAATAADDAEPTSTSSTAASTSTTVAAESTSSSNSTSSNSTSGTTGPGPDPVCGNGVQEEREACDGIDLGGTTCASAQLGEGLPTCNSNCSLNFGDCSQLESCPNGIVEGNEDCDGDNLNGATCESLAEFGGGTLSCDQSCVFNTSLCTDCLNSFAACRSDGQCCMGTCNQLTGCSLGGQ